MLYGMTSQDVKTGFPPFQDVFLSSSREKINVGDILEKWLLSCGEKSFSKRPFAIPSLSPILQCSNSSLIYYRFPGFEGETALTEEFLRKVEQMRLLEKISRICDKLNLEGKFLREEDKTKLFRTISEILNDIPFEQLKIPEDELFERMRGILLLEAASGILNELTPEQIKVFDEVVQRRPLFE